MKSGWGREREGAEIRVGVWAVFKGRPPPGQRRHSRPLYVLSVLGTQRAPQRTGLRLRAGTEWAPESKRQSDMCTSPARSSQHSGQGGSGPPVTCLPPPPHRPGLLTPLLKGELRLQVMSFFPFLFKLSADLFTTTLE